MDRAGPIICFDGVCGLCNRLIAFILRRDENGVFRYTPLQSQICKSLLIKYKVNSDELDTVYLVVNPHLESEYLLQKSDAIFYVLREIGGFWWFLSGLRVFPRCVLNFFYDRIASFRYRVFGKTESCAVVATSPEWKNRFLQ